MTAASANATLKRNLGPVSITLYGLGTTVGAGIYVLLGKVVAETGGAAIFAFLVAALVAAPSAYSFSVLSRLFPKSGGEAIYAHEAFRSAAFGTLVGLAVVMAGVVSGATLVTGFSGYFSVLFEADDTLIIVATSLLLGGIAIWGIRESVYLAGALTVIEVCGLLAIVASAGESLGDLPARWPELLPAASLESATAIAAGSIVAFYAFIGFEDIVNLAEEARNPRRALPLAIAGTLTLTTVLYGVLAVVAVMVLDSETLAKSKAPLADLFAATTRFGPGAVALIGMIAVLNGALVQIVKGARVIYGLAEKGNLPRAIGWVHPRRGTPVPASILLMALICILALFVELQNLAKTTSLITLLVFTTVNLSLLVMLRRPEGVIAARKRTLFIAILGFVASAGLALFQIVDTIGLW